MCLPQHAVSGFARALPTGFPSNPAKSTARELAPILLFSRRLLQAVGGEHVNDLEIHEYDND